MAGDPGIGRLGDPILDTATGPSWGAGASAGGWRVLRLVLLGCWLTSVVIGVAVGERTSSFQRLESDVAAGHVDLVRVAGSLPSHGRGFSVVEVHWRRGLVGYQTNVVEARPPKPEGRPSRWDATAVIPEGVGARLAAIRPGVRVVAVPRSTSSFSVLGWQLPGWMGFAALFLWLAVVFLLGNGPRPWRATRWAWFWLVVAAAPVGVPAFLILSGPAPPLPAPHIGARRLTGGWAFLLAAVISSALK